MHEFLIEILEVEIAWGYRFGQEELTQRVSAPYTLYTHHIKIETYTPHSKFVKVPTPVVPNHFTPLKMHAFSTNQVT